VTASEASARAGSGHAPPADGRDDVLERQSFVRHELRAPLAVMYPLLSLLLDEGAGPLTPAQRDYLAMLDRNVKRLHALIGSAAESGWLDCAAGAGRPEPVKLAEAAEDVVARLQEHDRGARVRISRGDGVPAAWADAEHVRCLVRNLVDNALRYAGGDVEVRVARAADGGVELRVQDSGPGMDETDAAAAFAFGVRGRAAAETGEPGMGIGLWVCRRLAEANGGRVELATAAGAGTGVTVTLPAARG
jgi:signal transduction histidine kinase